jgi:hypothetical protein
MTELWLTAAALELGVEPSVLVPARPRQGRRRKA